MMTKQEIFDTVVTHLRKQAVRSMRGPDCVYRSPDGLKCAVGCLIPDSEYKSNWEGYTVLSISEAPENKDFQSYLKSKVGLDNMKLLQALQRAHDNESFAPGHTWEDRFERIAEDFELTLLPKE